MPMCQGHPGNYEDVQTNEPKPQTQVAGPGFEPGSADYESAELHIFPSRTEQLTGFEPAQMTEGGNLPLYQLSYSCIFSQAGFSPASPLFLPQANRLGLPLITRQGRIWAVDPRVYFRHCEKV